MQLLLPLSLLLLLLLLLILLLLLLLRVGVVRCLLACLLGMLAMASFSAPAPGYKSQLHEVGRCFPPLFFFRDDQSRAINLVFLHTGVPNHYSTLLLSETASLHRFVAFSRLTLFLFHVINTQFGHLQGFLISFIAEFASCEFPTAVLDVVCRDCWILLRSWASG